MHIKTYLLLLGLILLTSLNAQIGVESFRVLENDLDARVNYPLKDQNGDVAAIIKVVTTETGFSFDGGMLGIVKTVNKTAEIWVYVPWGLKRLTITHPKLGMLRDYMIPVSIEKATVYEMKLVTGSVETTVKPIDMEFIIFTSTPDKSDVYVDEVYIGQTPTSIQRPSGSYTYRISHDKYHPDVGMLQFDVSKGKQEIHLELKPAFGRISVDTYPEQGAVVLLNGQETGKKTPCTLPEIATGEHRITVRKEWFIPKTVIVKVSDNQETVEKIELKANYVDVKITSDNNAELYIDGNKIGTSNWEGRLVAGWHNFEAKRTNHYDGVKRLELQIGEKYEFSLPVRPKLGHLQITTNVIGAIIYLNNKEYGKTPMLIKDLPIGLYTLKLNQPRGGSLTKNIIIEENKTLNLKEELVTGMQISVRTTPSGADFYINGVHKGVSPLTLTVPFGNHEFKVENGKRIVTEQVAITQGGKSIFEYEVNNNMRTRFSSSPKGVNLFINGQLKGKTPFEGTMKMGNYQVRLEYKGIKVEDEVEVKNKNNRFHYPYSYFAKDFYKKHPLSVSYGYVHTAFIDKAFRNNLRDGKMQRVYGQELGLQGTYYPFIANLSVFNCGFKMIDVSPFQPNSNIFHRGIELSIGAIPYSFGGIVNPYIMAGYHFSELYASKNSTLLEEKANTHIIVPLVKAGLRVQVNRVFLFGEIKRTVSFGISNYDSYQFGGGLGFIF